MDIKLHAIHRTPALRMLFSITLGGIGTALLGVLLFQAAEQLQLGSWLIGLSFLPLFAGIGFGFKSKKSTDFSDPLRLWIEKEQFLLADASGEILASASIKKIKVRSACRYISTAYGRGYSCVIYVSFPNLQKPLSIRAEGLGFPLKGQCKLTEPQYSANIRQLNQLVEFFDLRNSKIRRNLETT
jgi:hypothetical protein